MLKTIRWIVLVVATTTLFLGVLFVMTRPPEAVDVSLESSNEVLGLAATVPENQSDLFLVPNAGGTLQRLRANALSRDLLAERSVWLTSPLVPSLAGDGAAVVFRHGDHMAVRLLASAWRRALLRLFVPIASRGSMSATVVDGVLTVVTSDAPLSRSGERIGGAPKFAHGLVGQAFLIHGTDGRYEAIAPGSLAVTSIHLDRDRMELVSRSPSEEPRKSRPSRTGSPSGAWIAASWSEAPRVFRSLTRAFPVDTRDVIEGAEFVAIYTIDAGKLIPRPKGVLGFPRGEAADAVLQLIAGLPVVPDETNGKRTVAGVEIEWRRKLGLIIETTWKSDTLLMAFDDTSIEAFLTDTESRSPFDEGNVGWTMRIRPDLLLPALEKIAGRKELKYLARDLYDGARKLRDVTRVVGSGAGSIWIEERSIGDVAERRFVIEAKNAH